VRRTKKNLQQYYVAHGYPKAAVVPQSIVNDQEHLVTIAFDIQPQG
jgi:outer membrane protein assembly factor BamA